MTAARPRPAVLALVVLQVALPVGLLVARWLDEGTRPVTEYGASWQMYTSAPVPRYTGIDAAGVSRPLDAASLPPVLRAVSTGRVVPDRLCARHPDIVAVRRVGGPAAGDFRC